MWAISFVFPSIILDLSAANRRSSSSDVEEDGLALAAEMNVKGKDRRAIAHRARRDQGLAARRGLDDVEHGIVGIGGGLIAKVHPRGKADIDASRGNPDVDVRRHRLSPAPPHDRARLDGADAV